MKTIWTKKSINRPYKVNSLQKVHSTTNCEIHPLREEHPILEIEGIEDVFVIDQIVRYESGFVHIRCFGGTIFHCRNGIADTMLRSMTV